MTRCIVQVHGATDPKVEELHGWVYIVRYRETGKASNGID